MKNLSNGVAFIRSKLLVARLRKLWESLGVIWPWQKSSLERISIGASLLPATLCCRLAGPICFIRDIGLASAEVHKAAFEFMEIVVEAPLKRSISYFDRARTKRHRTLYNDVGLISEREAEELLRRAKEFLSYIESKLKER